MTIGFIFFMPTGALISRYYRIVFAPSWFRVSHLGGLCMWCIGRVHHPPTPPPPTTGTRVSDGVCGGVWTQWSGPHPRTHQWTIHCRLSPDCGRGLFRSECNPASGGDYSPGSRAHPQVSWSVHTVNFFDVDRVHFTGENCLTSSTKQWPS